MLRSQAPSSRRRQSRTRRGQRDREYRPGRHNNIVDDFAIMPRIPEERFRTTSQIWPAPIMRRHDPHSDQSIDWEYILPDVIETPMGQVRAQTPTDGYDGESIGMARCNECKSWFHPSKLDKNRCQDCSKPVNEVKSAVDGENRQK